MRRSRLSGETLDGQMLASHPELLSRKRFRGKRRKFALMSRFAREYVLRVGPDVSWYYEHEHLDWYGCGSRSWRFRRQTLFAHLTLLRNWAAQLRGHPGEFELWLRVAVHDACCDSVYVHSPSAYGPADFSGVAWSGDAVPVELARLAPDLVWGYAPDGGYYAFIPGTGRDPRV